MHLPRYPREGPTVGGREGRGDHNGGGWSYKGGSGCYGGVNGGQVKLLDQFCEPNRFLELKYLCCCDLVEATSVVAGKAREVGYGFMSFNNAS